MLRLLLLSLLILSSTHKPQDIFLDTFRQLLNVHNPDEYMSVRETIIYHGYPYEEHEVTTDDGYIITIQRIPFGKKSCPVFSRKPVLIQHGFICSSGTWISNTPDKNLPYILADAGYDVWLGNVRGNLFGLKHKTLSIHSDEFWAYSFHELAIFDLPATIDMILKKTGHKHIYYVGHSMGTTMAFVLLSLKPKYNDIIKAVFALAPVARLDHMRSALRLLTPFSEAGNWMLNHFGSRELILSNNGKLFQFLANTLCLSPGKFICINIIFLISGYSPDEFDSVSFDNKNLKLGLILDCVQARLQVFLRHTPAGTSVQNCEHYCQIAWRKKFQYYDFGKERNKIRYGQSSPPEYNLKNVKARVLLFWSDNDYLADPKDVAWLANQLPNVVLNYRIPKSAFSHMDFLWAIHSKTLVYDKVLSEMLKIN